MDIIERAKNIPGLDLDQEVYTITVEDALTVIQNELGDDLKKLDDLQLDLLIQATCDSFEHIEWVEYAIAGIDTFRWDNKELFEDDDEEGEE